MGLCGLNLWEVFTLEIERGEGESWKEGKGKEGKGEKGRKGREGKGEKGEENALLNCCS